MIVPVMFKRIFARLMGRPRSWIHLQHRPMHEFANFLLAVFLLFSIIGFYADLMNGGSLPYSVVWVKAALSGLNAVAWVYAFARLPLIFLGGLIALEFCYGWITAQVASLVQLALQSPPVDPVHGIRFAATSILVAVIASYVFFAYYMSTTGSETYRLSTELELAHGIQKTLVPPVEKKTPSFEIYGISLPSEKVGGDLVDVVELEGGDTVAHLADIAGHGLQAGILMGMLKTAARTALTEGASQQGAAALSMLMHRLNVILPQVKEAHMYATFTALRLNLNGEAFYGMAASPPLLLWSAASRTMTQIEEEQFPLGLLPVAEFAASSFLMHPGDVVLIATDGILEVSSKRGLEFGPQSLEPIIAANAALPLPHIAAAILKTVGAYGKQFDDQTLLLVRRNSI